MVPPRASLFRDLFRRLIFLCMLVALGFPFGSLLAHFWRPLVPFWRPIASLLAPVGFLLAPFGSFLAPFWCPLTYFCLPWSSIFSLLLPLRVVFPIFVVFNENVMQTLRFCINLKSNQFVFTFNNYCTEDFQQSIRRQYQAP